MPIATVAARAMPGALRYHRQTPVARLARDEAAL